MAIDIKDPELRKLFDHAIFFHGHLCPAMPLGLRAGIIGLKCLDVGRSRDKELFLISETAEGHAMACFLDGLMMSTGCTYGKGNCKKVRYGKMAFTLIDQKEKRQVRISVRPDFVLNALQNSPFIAQRKAGVPPQDIDPEIAEKAVNYVLSCPEEEIFLIGPVHPWEFRTSEGCFEAHPCTKCGEAIYAKWIRVKDSGLYCIPCSGYTEGLR